MKFFLFFCSFFLFFPFVFAESYAPVITEILHTDDPKVDEIIRIRGENFGVGEADLTVTIDGKNHTVLKNHGREIQVRLAKDTKSGFVQVSRKITVHSVSETVQSNKMELDLKTGVIEKIEAPDGIFPSKTVSLSGRNLSSSELFCGTRSLSLETQTNTNMSFRIPSQYLNCELFITTRDFTFFTGYTLKVLPDIEAVSLSTGMNNEGKSYIKVFGKNFSQYSEDMKMFSLQFFDGTKLSSPEYISDSEIYFLLGTTVVPGRGTANLFIADKYFPDIGFVFTDNLYSVEYFSRPLRITANTIRYDIITNAVQYSLNGGVYINGQKQTGTFSGTSLTADASSFPASSGQFWIENDGYRGIKTSYEYSYNTRPFLARMEFMHTITETGTGKVHISGENFYPSDTVEVSISGVSTEGNLSVLGPQQIEYFFPPHDFEKGKTYTLTVKTREGSDSLSFSLPQNAGTVLYSAPKIEKIDFRNGASSGDLMRIYGQGLEEITHASFNGKKYPIHLFTPHFAEVYIPEDIEETGEVALVKRDALTSNAIPYALQTEKKVIDFDFLGEETSLEVSMKEQTLFSFTVKNTNRDIKGNIEFSYDCTEECTEDFPFSGVALYDRLGKKIPVFFDKDALKKTFLIRDIEIPYSDELQTYFLKGKAFFSPGESKTVSFTFLETRFFHRFDDAVIASNSLTHSNPKNTVYIPAEFEDSFEICLLFEKEKTFQSCYETEETEGDSSSEENTEEIFEENNNEEMFEEEEISDEEHMAKMNIPERVLKEEFPFQDVSLSDWYYDSVKDLWERSIVSGTSTNNFSPSGNLTRAELLVFVLRARGEEAVEISDLHFHDIETHWAKNEIEYALSQNYIRLSRNFQPTKKVTRAETALMMCKLFPVLSNQETETHFTDMKDHWAKNCVMSAYDAGIIQGISSYEFSPDSFITRAEFSKMLSLLLQLLDPSSYEKNNTQSLSEDTAELSPVLPYDKEECSFEEENSVWYFEGKRVSNRKAFVSLGGCYGKDDIAVFYKNQRLENVSVKDFEYLEFGYAKDTKKVFFEGQRVGVANAITFVSRGGGYGVDKNYAFFRGRYFFAHLETLEPALQWYAQDKDEYYFLNQKITDTNEKEILKNIFPERTLFSSDELEEEVVEDMEEEVVEEETPEEDSFPSPFLKKYTKEVCSYKIQGNQVFFKNELLPDSFSPLFQKLSECYAQKSDIFYYKAEKIVGTTGNIGKVLGYAYFTDTKRIFFQGKLVGLADASTFEVLHGYLARDKNFVFYRGVRVPVDKETVVSIDTNYFADTEGVYYWGKKVTDEEILAELEKFLPKKGEEEESEEILEEENLEAEESFPDLTLSFVSPAGNIRFIFEGFPVSFRFNTEVSKEELEEHLVLVNASLETEEYTVSSSDNILWELRPQNTAPQKRFLLQIEKGLSSLDEKTFLDTKKSLLFYVQ
jgi:hypothetical protein